MREGILTLVLVLRLGWRTNRRLAAVMMSMVILSVVCGSTFAVWARFLVQAFHTHDVVGVGVVGIVGLGGTYLVTIYLGQQAIALASRMQTLIESTLDEELEDLIFGISSLRRLESQQVARAARELSSTRQLIGRGYLLVAQVLSAYARFLVIVVILIVVSPVIPLVALIAIPSILLAALATRLHAAADASSVVVVRRVKDILEVAASPVGSEDLAVRGRSEWLAEAMREVTSERYDGRGGRRAIAWTLLVTAWLLYGAAFAGALVVVVLQSQSAALAIIDSVIVVFLVAMVRDQIAGLIGLGPAISALRDAVSALVVLRSAMSGPSAPTSAATSSGGSDGIVADDVTAEYELGGTVLRNLSFHVPAGKVLVVCGANGSGKSTLVRLLSGLYAPVHGRMDGVPPHSETAILFQDYLRPGGTVGEAVAIGRLFRPPDAREIERAIERAGMANHLNELADGLETAISDGYDEGRALSGGQWQGYALARTLVRVQPVLRILDEPTASLDPARAAASMKRLFAEARTEAEHGTITVIVTHDLEVVGGADLVMVLENGELAGFGTPDEVANLPAIQRLRGRGESS